jgi:superfamily II helicase
LKILNVNKTSFNKIIKIIKEFIIMLEKLNPNEYDSFDAIYKKTQNDLYSYEVERKVFKNKIKTLEEKTKNIPEKKIRLKTKISNLFKEFKKCLKT